MKHFLSKIGVILSALIILGFANVAYGAALSINVSQESFKIGDEFDADVKINSEDVGINAAQATIKFSPAVLEAVSIDKTSSVFNFWIQDPKIDNANGEINFIGGSSSGLVGKSLQVIRVVFKAKGLGQSDFIFTDGAITASDGSGTNVLSSMPKTAITVGEAAAETANVKLIERTPITSDTVPAKPVVKVSLYPDPAKWYNSSSKFSASWTLGSDVSAVATALNKNPASIPTTSEGIFDNESFSALSDGVWYLHVRFYNNMGWSETTHYRLAIDTVLPATFDIKFADSLPTNNPTPSISYQANDQLSGIDHYYIQIDQSETINTNLKSYTLPIQTPGKHKIKVGAQDKAGNRVENTAEFEILPIESPKIFSTSANVYVGEGGLIINGTSLAGVSIILNIRDQKDNLIYNFTTNADEKGNWAMKIDSPLKKGIYYIEVTAQDSKGALSYPVKSDAIKVQERPIMVLWGFNVTYIELVIFLLFILIGGFGAGWYFNKLTNSQRQRRILISQRDVSAGFNVIKKDIEKIIKSWDDKKIEEFELTQMEFVLKDINGKIEKLQKYIIMGIKDIGNK